MQDERWSHPLYTATAINDEGLEGHAYIPGGLKVQTSSPMNDHPGTNPEQLLGLSLSTCLEATLEAVEKEHGLPHTGAVLNINFWCTPRSWSKALISIPLKPSPVKSKIAVQFRSCSKIVAIIRSKQSLILKTKLPEANDRSLIPSNVSSARRVRNKVKFVVSFCVSDCKDFRLTL